MDDLDLVIEDQEGGDDDLADVADGRVQDSADPRPGRDAQLLGGMAEEVGEGEDRERGDAEGEGRIGVQDAQREGRGRPDRGEREGGDTAPSDGTCEMGGGDEGTRTPDPRDANAVLSQLSYIPTGRREYSPFPD